MNNFEIYYSVFESSNEIKKMFVFASNLSLVDDMIKNKTVCYHVTQLIKTLDKIVNLLTCKSTISEHEKNNLVELGKLHYHFGLKKEHFKV
jgi:hypothetical protein